MLIVVRQENFEKSRILESVQQQNIDKTIQMEALSVENASLNAAYQGMVNKYNLMVKDHEKLLQDFVATKRSLTSEISMLLAYNEEMKRKLEPFRDHMRETLPQRQISNGSSFDSNLLSRSDQDKPSLVTNEVVARLIENPTVEQLQHELSTIVHLSEGGRGAGAGSRASVPGLVFNPSSGSRFFSILSLIPGTVAADCGMMQAGDVVYKIDGVEQDGVELEALLEALEGAPGSEVTLEMGRRGDGEEMRYRITLARGT